MVRTFGETGYKQTSKNPKNNNKIPTTLPFSFSTSKFIILGRNLDKEIEVKRNNKGKGK